MTASSDAERQRRSRAHRRGDHRWCLHAADQHEQPEVTAVTEVTPAEPLEARLERAAPVSTAVDAALEAAGVPGMDAGAVALARQYAALIDEAAIGVKYLEPLALIERALRVSPLDDQATARAFVKITAALSAHSVASDLGPKLLAALTALGMTAAGRGTKTGGDQGGAAPVASELDKLRARRAQRGG